LRIDEEMVMTDVLLFAKGGDLGQAIIPIVFLIVWIIGAAAKWFGQQQQQQQLPPARRPGNRPLPRASDAELEEFVRQYVGDRPPAPTPPVKPKPLVRGPAPKIGNTRPQERAANRSMEGRHLHSQLEGRQTQDMHSRLEGSHLRGQNVATELTAMGIEGQVASRKGYANRFVGSMLDRGNIARAMILGQVLQQPAGLEGEANGPLGPPAAMRS
jgi:hypothetical protein